VGRFEERDLGTSRPPPAPGRDGRALAARFFRVFLLHLWPSCPSQSRVQRHLGPDPPFVDPATRIVSQIPFQAPAKPDKNPCDNNSVAFEDVSTCARIVRITQVAQDLGRPSAPSLQPADSCPSIVVGGRPHPDRSRVSSHHPDDDWTTTTDELTSDPFAVSFASPGRPGNPRATPAGCTGVSLIHITCPLLRHAPALIAAAKAPIQRSRP